MHVAQYSHSYILVVKADTISFYNESTTSADASVDVCNDVRNV